MVGRVRINRITPQKKLQKISPCVYPPNLLPCSCDSKFNSLQEGRMKPFHHAKREGHGSAFKWEIL